MKKIGLFLGVLSVFPRCVAGAGGDESSTITSFAETGNDFVILGDFIGPSLTNTTDAPISITNIDFRGFAHEGGRIGFTDNQFATNFSNVTFDIDSSGNPLTPFVVAPGESFIFQFNQEQDDDRPGARFNRVQQGAPSANDQFRYNFTTAAFAETSPSAALPITSAPAFDVYGTMIPEPSEPVLTTMELTGNSFNVLGNQVGGIFSNNNDFDVVVTSLGLTGIDSSGGFGGLSVAPTNPTFAGSPIAFDADGALETAITVPVGESFFYLAQWDRPAGDTGAPIIPVQQGEFVEGGLLTPETPVASGSFDSPNGNLPQNQYPGVVINGFAVPEPSAQISSFSESPEKTGFEITFTPLDGFSYLVQGSPDLSESSWETLPATQVGESVITATVLKADLSGDPSRYFFRLLQCPVPSE